MSANKPPSDLQAHQGYWLRVVSNAVSQNFARKLQMEGVTVAEWVVLRLLFDVDRMAPSRLAEEMGVTKGAVSRLADRLAEKALIERAENPDDKRAHSLALSRAGRALVPYLADLADKNDAEFFGVLSDMERQLLRKILQGLVLRHDLGKLALD
ncbi:MAG TPA: MarR family transcriptional regulator [Hyphomonas sp.]|jgi:DNA-binding MarR family transcriptional regulator|uniref:MarR family winged helix-turn-helix transcriptional regulator n=1 Tax=Sneathiella sp. TaxID=1964365 RepID=UPI000C6163F2|nr:MarR family transcriptional regulator [Sneathiella sp.]MAL78734.1 MarR family transcriptional regulator [Sneathiella sp.]HCE23023.1 MarR family transcriptional regulator [Hyphomonas sp.]|tara:strand:- start:1793 stop:2254 length:462 start_codon:yes stop_codon:yes gene_type:complete